MSKKTVKVEAQLNRVDALNILRDAIGNDTDAVKALDVFTRVNKKTANTRGLKAEHVLVRGAQSPNAGYIADRVELADGMTVADAMKTVPNGHHGAYRYVDINYDIKLGYLQDPRS